MIPSGETFMAKAREFAAELQSRVYGGRGYRYEGEREAHAEQLRETQVSLSMMATASEDPDHVRMASEIEHGAENQLAVLLGKPRLTLEEKRTRDAIQAALGRRRQGFGPTVSKTETVAPRRFLGALTASPALAILLSPVTWLIALAALLGVQTLRLNHAKGDLHDARADLAAMEDSRDAYARTLADERAAHANDVAQVLEDTATTVDQMRRAQARQRAREQRERQRNEDLARGTNDYARRLRELAAPDEAVPPGPAAAPGGDPAGAMPTGPDAHANDGANR